MKHLSVLLLMMAAHSVLSQVLLPIGNKDRTSGRDVQLTSIGEFGLMRKARPGIPAHFHTGVDIRRPSKNYQNEPIFSIAKGIVVSRRDDGPYAQLIIAHHLPGEAFWTVYEHIAGIRVSVGEEVNVNRPIARFMNRTELDKYGWQFDHFHFEVLKFKPRSVKPDPKTPTRYFSSYTLDCVTSKDLSKYFHNPLHFLKRNF